MFTDVFTIKKNSWHVKLMKYMWGLDHKDFSHICPYFWLSIFNVIVSPVFVPVKLTFRMVLPFIGRCTYKFCSWAWDHIEAAIEALGERLDKWAIAQQAKWEARRKEELKRMQNSPSFQKFIEVRKNYEHIIERNDTYELYRLKKGSKKERKLAKWLKIFIDLHRIEPQTYQALKSKDEEITLQEETKKQLVVLAQKEREQTRLRKLEELHNSEEFQQKLAYANSIREQQEMAAHAKKVAKQEAEKLARELADKRAIEKADIRKQNKARIVKLLKVIKPIATGFVYIIGSAAALIGIYYLYVFIRWVVAGFAQVEHKTYISIGNTLKWAGIVIVGLAVLVGVIYAIVQLCRRITIPAITIPKPKFKRPKISIPLPDINTEPLEKFLDSVGRIIVYIAKLFPKGVKYFFMPFVWFIRGVRLFFRILIQTIKNNCPAIDWKD